MNKNGVEIPTTNGQDEGLREFGIIHFETKVRNAKGKKDSMYYIIPFIHVHKILFMSFYV